ncbi:probable glutathione S-transferase [Lotus japonicus]|uniref:probable glutathione S-transferase n=1 Tax=Lotus japonicus TaxID=34305 RepID=UPI00258C21C6|nr:probable glutathione S-transferase [Lotus japonicus]
MTRIGLGSLKYGTRKLVVPTAWKSVFTTDEKEREKNIEESSEALQFLEHEVKDHKFLGGDEFGFVDIAAVFIAFWIPVIQEVIGLQLFTAENFPKLYIWSQEILNHPVVKECLPPKEPLFAMCKAHYESIVGVGIDCQIPHCQLCCFPTVPQNRSESQH